MASTAPTVLQRAVRTIQLTQQEADDITENVGEQLADRLLANTNQHLAILAGHLAAAIAAAAADKEKKEDEEDEEEPRAKRQRPNTVDSSTQTEHQQVPAPAQVQPQIIFINDDDDDDDDDKIQFVKHVQPARQ